MHEARQSSEVVLAILAGGAGRRIGGGKALVELGGRPLISFSIEAARRASLETIVVSKPDSSVRELERLGARVVSERHESVHPLAGILAALSHVAPRPILAVGCDMPFLTPGLLECLTRARGAAVVELRDRMQPLLARHLGAYAGALEEALTREDSLTATLDHLGYERIMESALERFGDPSRLCFNVNDREDVELAESWLVAAGGDAFAVATAGSR
ncbi:MAG: molybdenum cofactor guanylyltransferase [Solirubrobacteraceae bacterium]